MTELRPPVRETITEDTIERRETLHDDFEPAVSHHEAETGGAVGVGVVGAVISAVVAGPVGAVVGAALGAATGATAAAIDGKVNEERTVVTREVRRS